MALLTTKAPSRQVHQTKEGLDMSASRALGANLRAPAVGASSMGLFPRSHHLFERVAHPALPNLLDLFFHLSQTGICIHLKRERYCYLHERFLSVSDVGFDVSYHSSEF